MCVRSSSWIHRCHFWIREHTFCDCVDLGARNFEHLPLSFQEASIYHVSALFVWKMLAAVYVAHATLHPRSHSPLCSVFADGWLFPSYITAVTAD